MAASEPASGTRPEPIPLLAEQSGRMIAVSGLVAGAFFMEMLDGTVIATALPAMARSFGVNPVDLNIGMTAYLLTLAVFIPLSGWVAERHGTRSVFGSAIAIFTLSSVLCGSSEGLWSFTAARVLQGIGGALMVPVGRLVVLRNTPKTDLVRAIALMTWPALLAPVLGPAVGGFITAHASWRWIFYLNVPLGALGLVLTLWLVPNQRGGQRRRLDAIGFLLVGAACVGLVIGCSLIGSNDGSVGLPGLLIGVSLLACWLAVWHSRRTPSPLLDFAAFRIPTFAVGNIAGSLQFATVNAAPFLLPLMFQIGFGLDPFTSGLLVLALFAGNIAMKPLTTGIMRRFGFRRVLIGNGTVAALSIAACGLLRPDTPVPLVAAVLFVGGMCRSMQFTALGTMTFADVPQPAMNAANVITSLLHQLTLGMGVAVGAIALRLASLILGTPPKSLTVADFHVAFTLVAVVCLASLIPTFGLAPDAGAQVSGHRLGSRDGTI